MDAPVSRLQRTGRTKSRRYIPSKSYDCYHASAPCVPPTSEEEILHERIVLPPLFGTWSLHGYNISLLSAKHESESEIQVFSFLPSSFE